MTQQFDQYTLSPEVVNAQSPELNAQSRELATYNYVFQLIHRLSTGDFAHSQEPQNLNAYIAELKKSITTHITEHPYSNMAGMSPALIAKPLIDNDTGAITDYTAADGITPLTEIVQNACIDANNKGDTHMAARYATDERLNTERLRGRQSGSSNHFVLLSPAPDNWQEMPQFAGFNGNASVQISHPTGDNKGNESTDLLWLKDKGIADYQDLAQRILASGAKLNADMATKIAKFVAIDPNEPMPNLDLAVLDLSGEYPPQASVIIKDWVLAHNPAKDELFEYNGQQLTLVDLIARFINNHRIDLDGELSRVYDGVIYAALSGKQLDHSSFQGAIHGQYKDLAINSSNIIADIIIRYQNLLIAFLNHVTNPQQGNIEHNNYRQMMDYQQQGVLSQQLRNANMYSAQGACIIARNGDKYQNGVLGYGSHGSPFAGQSTPDYRALVEFICGSCGYYHCIDVPKGQYVEVCRSCGVSARC